MVTQDISHVQHDPQSQAEAQECTQSFRGWEVGTRLDIFGDGREPSFFFLPGDDGTPPV